ncbi:hypothetical protein Moror_14766 [Moniliophthora roreri MCA 2997]|uniref:Uncharacterized protein n=1 Tax=Moniliophthora roreri (strain MCA 2997) TaxID=1381753 RepID=V2X7C1_MONRO|nr:hypothetical protein Moror_14766 [Moniliophthora roreri MCA 2997]
MSETMASKEQEEEEPSMAMDFTKIEKFSRELDEKISIKDWLKNAKLEMDLAKIPENKRVAMVEVLLMSDSPVEE